MNNRIVAAAHNGCHRFVIKDVFLKKAVIWKEIVFRPGREIVKHINLEPAVRKISRNMAADIPCPADDQHIHAVFPFGKIECSATLAQTGMERNIGRVRPGRSAVQKASSAKTSLTKSAIYKKTTPFGVAHMPPIRIELMTHGFSVHCSTN